MVAVLLAVVGLRSVLLVRSVIVLRPRDPPGGRVRDDDTAVAVVALVRRVLGEALRSDITALVSFISCAACARTAAPLSTAVMATPSASSKSIPDPPPTRPPPPFLLPRAALLGACIAETREEGTAPP